MAVVLGRMLDWASGGPARSTQRGGHSAGVKARTVSHITRFESWLLHFAADLLGLWN